ncbi:hypothetical protein KM043_004027 [Ampulex compressa]|nr:hypothetical protein KM043_004027 [Ampulex compressa]
MGQVAREMSGAVGGPGGTPRLRSSRRQPSKEIVRGTNSGHLAKRFRRMPSAIWSAIRSDYASACAPVSKVREAEKHRTAIRKDALMAYANTSIASSRAFSPGCFQPPLATSDSLTTQSVRPIMVEARYS